MGSREIHLCRGCDEGRAIDGYEFCSEGCEQRFRRNAQRIARIRLPASVVLYAFARSTEWEMVRAPRGAGGLPTPENLMSLARFPLCQELAEAAVGIRYTGQLMRAAMVPELGVGTQVVSSVYLGPNPHLHLPVDQAEDEPSEVILVRIALPEVCDVYPPVSVAWCREHGRIRQFSGQNVWAVDASLIATEYVEQWP